MSNYREKYFNSQRNYHKDAIDQNSQKLPHLIFNHIGNNLAQQQLHKSLPDNILKGVKITIVVLELYREPCNLTYLKPAFCGQYCEGK